MGSLTNAVIAGLTPDEIRNAIRMIQRHGFAHSDIAEPGEGL